MAEFDKDFGSFRGFRLNKTLKNFSYYDSSQDTYIGSTGRFDLTLLEGLREIEEDYVDIVNNLYSLSSRENILNET